MTTNFNIRGKRKEMNHGSREIAYLLESKSTTSKDPYLNPQHNMGTSTLEETSWIVNWYCSVFPSSSSLPLSGILKYTISYSLSSYLLAEIESSRKSTWYSGIS